MKSVIWSIAEIVNILKARQANEFDGNIAVSGDRGNGKSTFINKSFRRFGRIFKPWLHQVYSRDAVIELLRTQTFSLCWDDEAINTGYKRNWQDKGQQELIKMLTAYRDNYNIFASAIPNFFSLDKDLRDLYFLHIHVIERGIAVVHMPLQGRLYSQDRWDAKYNAKIEESWSKRYGSHSKFTPPYNRLSTFRGYLYFNDVTDKQKALYKEIKKEKRAEAFKTANDQNQITKLSFIEKLYNQLKEKKLTRDGLQQSCLIEGKKYSSISSLLNRMLVDNGDVGTVKDFLRLGDVNDSHSKIMGQINNIIPET